MAGRRAKPIEIHLLDGNKSHLTKAEIEHRRQSEIKLGERKVICPMYVKNNKEAYKKWKEILKIYKNTELISTADVGMLARYCITFSEYLDLIKHRAVIENIPWDETDNFEAVEILNEYYSRLKVAKLVDKINYIMSVGGLLAMDKAINAKMDQLVKMEDRLFLNPLAKIKNIPKEPPKEEVDPLQEKGFGNI